MGEADSFDFALFEIPQLPDQTTCLYRHFDKDGQLLYVGISLNAMARLCEHREKSHWFNLIARIEIERFDTRQEALAAERKAIETEKPLHNVDKPFGPAWQKDVFGY